MYISEKVVILIRALTANEKVNNGKCGNVKMEQSLNKSPGNQSLRKPNSESKSKSVVLPMSTDWRNVNDLDWSTPIKDQGLKELNVNQLDEKEELIADALIFLGLERPVARTLAYLNNRNEVTSFELKIATGLRQPEVSIAIRQLKERDWVNEREEKKTGKGRPNEIYSLKVGFNDIIARLENQQKKAVDESQKKIEGLWKMGYI
jgi:predicted transcriptional regulator